MIAGLLAATIASLLVVGAIGVVTGWIRYGDEYWKYGAIVCAMRQAHRDYGYPGEPPEG